MSSIFMNRFDFFETGAKVVLFCGMDNPCRSVFSPTYFTNSFTNRYDNSLTTNVFRLC